MYKKTIITLLLFLAPIAFFEHHKKGSTSQIINNKYDITEKYNFHSTDRLFEDDEKRIEIKNCWEEGDLLSQKRYCAANENVLHDL